MKRWLLFLLIPVGCGVLACGDAATNIAVNTNANRVTNTSATRTPSSNQTNMSTPGNTISNTNVPTNIPARTPTTDRTPSPTSTPPTVSEKQDEGLFSFPPPKVTGYAAIDPRTLMNPEGPTDFSYVAEKLASRLRRAGYTDDKYKFFWNDRNEFAIVTAMERISKDGTPLGILDDGTNTHSLERWNSSTSLPRASSVAEYFGYLFAGKRVFYRVFGFVVTPRRYRRNFYSNSSPDFTMAVNWMKKGEAQLGDGESGSIEFVPFTDEYNCFALLYLFVNHTSLDSPRSVDTLEGKDQIELKDGLDLTTENHLRLSGIDFAQ